MKPVLFLAYKHWHHNQASQHESQYSSLHVLYNYISHNYTALTKTRCQSGKSESTHTYTWTTVHKQLTPPKSLKSPIKRTKAIGKWHHRWNAIRWNTDRKHRKQETYWFGLLRTYIFKHILAAVLPGCFGIPVWGWRASVGHGVLPLHDLNRVKTHFSQLLSSMAHCDPELFHVVLLPLFSCTYTQCISPMLYSCFSV